MKLAFYSLIALVGAAFLVADVTPSAALTPCAKSRMKAERKKTSDEGIECRNKNIDTVLNEITGVWDLRKLKKCLVDARNELNGRVADRNSTGQSGAGTEYYSRLNRCKKMAKLYDLGRLDSADSDCAVGDTSCASRQEAQAKPNADEAQEVVRQFMTDTPEPDADDED